MKLGLPDLNACYHEPIIQTSLCGCRPISRCAVAVQDNVDPVTLAEVAATTVVLISTSMVAKASSMLNTPSAVLFVILS